MPTSATAGPILLFDGVCNLCNSAVQWVITRDKKQVFRFASLQSAAGRAAIEERIGAEAAAQLPDSVVLLDERGLHTRSDAAIGVASRLGFPWSLAVVARVLPRAIRDRVYELVARNRYRWFGRQSACTVPTPALRSRFLDAGEVPATPAAAVDPAARTPARRNVLLAWLHRFALVYLVLHVLPFPLAFPFPYDAIPGAAWLAATFDSAQQSAVVAFARLVIDDPITVFPNGSGDTTYNWVQVLFFAVVALLAATAWTWRKRGAAVNARTVDVTHTYLRVFLAVTMLSYGWIKVFPLQMPAPAPGRLMASFGDTSPMGLLWTFMGASSAYQSFAGACEVLGGLLLLWRRTALLGAVVSVGVLANIVAMNFFFDVPVKIFSSHLLLMAMVLAAPHAMRLAGLLFFNVPVAPAVLHPFPIRNKWGAPAITVAKIALVALVAVWPSIQNWQRLREGSVRPQSPLHGIWRVESFVRDGVADRANEDRVRWVRFGAASLDRSAVQFADGHVEQLRFEIDDDAKALRFRASTRPGAAPSTPPPALAFREVEPDVFEVEGDFANAKVVVRLRREIPPEHSLATRGFHWINEYPLNR